MKTSLFRILSVALTAAGSQAQGQQQIDLRSQSKNPDLSASPFTRVFKTGTTLPANCVVGDSFFKTDAVAGRNLFGCTSADTWTALAGGLDAGVGMQMVGSTISVEDAVIPFYATGSGAPTIPCQAGRDHYVDTTNGKAYVCVGPDSWGEMARLDRSNIFSAGQKQTFGPSGSSAGVNVGAVAGDPTPVVDGDIWYDTMAGRFRCREDGASKDCIGLGSGQGFGMQGVITPVRDSDWTDMNMGVGSEKLCVPDCSTPGRVAIKSGDSPGELYGRKIPVPAGDYVRTFTILPMPDVHQYATAGVGWYASDNGKLTVCNLVRDATTAAELEVRVGYYDDFSSLYLYAPPPGFTVPAGQPVSFRLSLENGMRTCEISLDNMMWFPLLSVPNTFLETPDHLVYTVSGSAPARQSRNILISYK